MHLARICGLSVLLAASGCQQPTTSNQASASPQANAKANAELDPPAASNTTRFESPRAVYKQYADMLNSSRWAEAIALFSEAGKARLALANFKALAVLAGKQHAKQAEYKAVLHDFCVAHSLRCADESWNAVFTPTLLEQGNVANLLSDVTSLAAAKPEATYVEVMKLLKGVDSSSVLPLDPTLSEVIYLKNTATGVARRADGQSSTMSFESSAERGWFIVE